MMRESEKETGTRLFLRARASHRTEDIRKLEGWIGSDERRLQLVESLARVWEGVGAIANLPKVALLRHRPELAVSGPVFRIDRKKAYIALAASLLIAVLTGFALMRVASPSSPVEQQFASAVGAPRLIRLADGSQIKLDAASLVTVDFSDRQRVVKLLKGQARFHVAHDTKRPFHVEVADGDVRALGTDFNVTAMPSQFAVSLIEGSVLISRIEQRKTLLGLRHKIETVPIVTLLPGQQFSRTRDGAQSLRDFDLQIVTAWEKGRLVFQNMPLVDAVAIVNRYSRQQIEIDPALPPISFTAVLNANDAVGFGHTVTAYLPGSYLEISPTRIFIRQADGKNSAVRQ